MPIATTNAPARRRGHSAVWTGDGMIIWGGYQGKVEPFFNNGGIHHPASSNCWVSVATPADTTAARARHTAVWTGDKMIIWGGYVDTNNPIPTRLYLNSGGSYTPSTLDWTALSMSGAPSGRADHTSVWTGEEMIIWGETRGTPLSNGARYRPGGRGWIALPQFMAAHDHSKFAFGARWQRRRMDWNGNAGLGWRSQRHLAG